MISREVSTFRDLPFTISYPPLTPVQQQEREIVRVGIDILDWVRLSYPTWTPEQQQRHADRLRAIDAAGLTPTGGFA